jgi:flagellar FliL protein
MAEGEQKVDAAAAEAPPAAAGTARTGRAVPTLLAVNTIAIIAVVALQIVQLVRPGGLRHEARAEEHAAAPERHEIAEKKPDGKESQPGPTVRLADFIVHLRDPDSDRYARISFEIELPDEKAKEAVTARVPQIRDTFLAYLSDRTTEELRGSDAIARVKAALAQKLAELAPTARVRGLYITELVVQ